MAKFLTGVLAGIAIGMLVAPDKGSNTRQKISDAFNDLLGEANQKADDLQDQFANATDGYSGDGQRPVAKISDDF